MIVAAILLLILGAGTEALIGSFHRLFDMHWPKQRYPVGGNPVRLIAGRIALLIGVILLVVALIDAVV
jgi:hypothetical protein